MKKLTLFILLFSALLAGAQRNDYDLTLDLATAPADTTLQRVFFSESPWGVQITGESLTGTLDAEVAIYYSQDGVLWDIIDSSTFPLVVSATPYSVTVIDEYFPIKYIGFKVTKNGATGGTINFKVTK